MLEKWNWISGMMRYHVDDIGDTGRAHYHWQWMSFNAGEDSVWLHIRYWSSLRLENWQGILRKDHMTHQQLPYVNENWVICTKVIIFLLSCQMSQWYIRPTQPWSKIGSDFSQCGKHVCVCTVYIPRDRPLYSPYLRLSGHGNGSTTNQSRSGDPRRPPIRGQDKHATLRTADRRAAGLGAVKSGTLYLLAVQPNTFRCDHYSTPKYILYFFIVYPWRVPYRFFLYFLLTE